MSKNPNHLANETSPYLLQHAHNPVEWYPWGEEALQKAISEDKPILVSIGYAACHWCHVMEKESFEDEKTAGLMNQHFVNIKIDREERPDLDHLYMDAVQAMTGSGGWPLNVFLTPDRKPFYGGTYFPPVPAYNRPSWQEILAGVASAFRERRDEVEEQAKQMVDHLGSANDFGIRKPEVLSHLNIEERFPFRQAELAFASIMKTADRQWGGFGRAPKFPQCFVIDFLFRYQDFTGDKEALDQALLSIDKMIRGGIYDQVGGGFARYSTDTEWLAPHFEKMLYDNALLVMVLSDVFQITGRKEYREVLEQTLSFITTEMMSPEFGFYSAFDADSEGVEGKYYVWEKSEVDALLGVDSALFCNYYDITEKGNWEKKNILRVPVPLEEFADSLQLDPGTVSTMLRKGREILYSARSKRIPPLLDDKILLGWNALMCIGLCRAYAASGIESYREMAVRNMDFLLKSFTAPDHGLHHVYKAGQARFPAFLDDYACLIKALFCLQEITGDPAYLAESRKWIIYCEENFSDADNVYFYFTRHDQEDILVRKKDLYDGAVPSGNSVMAFNLYQGSILLGEKQWKDRSLQMIDGVAGVVQRYPASFGNWSCLLLEWMTGTHEVAVLGPEAQKVSVEILRHYIPNRVMQFARSEKKGFPLLEGKGNPATETIFLCREYTCKRPVFEVQELIQLIELENKTKRHNI